MALIDFRSCTEAELADYLAGLGQPQFRANQLFRWLQSGVGDFEEMTNLPKGLRGQMRSDGYLAGAEIVKRQTSRLDETVKYVFRLHDGALIESVKMQYKHGTTLCISTQVGCNMRCSFCASGLNGKARDLSASEMLAQIFAAQKDSGQRISGVVLMGMGEPLDNLDNTVRFLQLVSNEQGLNIGLRHISVSTCGVVPGILKLAEYKFPITLSVSLHAPEDALRSRLMPVNQKWGLKELLEACKAYQAATTRRISFEYAMIRNVNDSDACARMLASCLKGILSHVNLIPANPVVEHKFVRSDNARVKAFAARLEALGINATIRRTLGADIDASCGQLRRRIEAERGNRDANLQ